MFANPTCELQIKLILQPFLCHEPQIVSFEVKFISPKAVTKLFRQKFVRHHCNFVCVQITHSHVILN